MFQGIIILNLDQRPDRLKRTLEQIAASDLSALPLYRLRAHDGSALNMDTLLTSTAEAEMANLARTGTRRFHAQLSPGAVGCYLSHVDAWRFIAEKGSANPYLVLEDDVTLRPQALAFLHAAWARGKAKAGSLPLFQLYMMISCMAGCEPGADGMYEPKAWWGTQAYALSASDAAALLKAPGLFPMDIQIDSKLRHLRDAGHLTVQVLQFFESNSRDTNIQMWTVKDAPIDRP